MPATWAGIVLFSSSGLTAPAGAASGLTAPANHGAHAAHALQHCEYGHEGNQDRDDRQQNLFTAFDQLAVESFEHFSISIWIALACD